MKTFMETLNAKLRSHDAYGVWKNLDDETVITRHFIKTKEERKKIDVYGRMPDEVTAKIRLFYEAVAQTVEWQTQKMALTVLDINTEGFGRALIIYEDRILALDVLRNAHKFSFKDMDEIEATGQKIVDKCLKNIVGLE